VPALGVDEHDDHAKRVLRDFGMLEHRFSDEEIIRARRGHYGSISYLDAKIASIIETLKQAGAYENTVIIFTSDHGDYLGERGLWFKKHFHEPSIRIPLVISAPWIKPQRVSELVSLVDILPTFNGLADGKPWEETDGEMENGGLGDGGPEDGGLEGLDMTSLLDRPPGLPTRTIHAEYLAESALAPIYMVRRGCYKLIWSSRDPALLYDLEADPLEQHNVAGQPQFADVMAELEREVHEHWDDEGITRDVLASQHRRRLIRQANGDGTPPRWNHGETPGQKVPWYRGDQGYSKWAFPNSTSQQ